MKVWELKDLLDTVTDTEAVVCIGHDDDNFYDGEPVTCILMQSIQGKTDTKNHTKLTIVGDPCEKPFE